jgi:AbiV family abortive infection protein
MAREYFTELTDELLLELVDKSLINAQTLIDDGDLLLENGRYSRASVLYQLANEESGKALMSYVALLFHYKDYPGYLKKFNGAFFDHLEKSERSTSADFFVAKILYKGQSEKMIDFIVKRKGVLGNMSVNELNEMKNFCLYTSLRNNKVVIPDQLITKKTASNMQLTANIRLKWTKGVTQLSAPQLLDLRKYKEENPVNFDKYVKELGEEIFGKQDESIE